MSDVDEVADMLEDLLSKHRKEKKALKEKCLNLKKVAKTGNKQKQKETSAQIEQLEKELEQKHKAELEIVKPKETVEVVEANIEKDPITNDNEEASYYSERKMTGRQAKRQAKKDEQAKRVQEAILEDRQNSSSSLRIIELKAINKVLDDQGLQLFDIAPDGDCLYNAIAHQLSKISGNETTTGKDMRRRAATYLLGHKDDFAPFLTNSDGEPLDEFEFEEYCENVRNEAKDGGVWGGEPELNAMSLSLERKIIVIQPEGRFVTFGEQFTTKPLTVVYHRHAYQLGEHYNSTQLKSVVA
ncbi:unnamed protein product [Auanema sp. JU1783]|nr:unnamed protein product [Auanema sp. JU1783]